MSAPKKSVVINAGGWRLPMFGRQSKLTAILANCVNEYILAPLNALGHLEVKRGQTDGVIYGEGGIIIQIRDESLSGLASGRLATCLVKSRVSNVLTCRSWNGIAEGGSDIFVAVNDNSRLTAESATELLAGTTYTYTGYSPIDDWNYSRNASDGVDNETQIVTPLWRQDCIIQVMRTTYTGLFDDDGNAVTLIEVSARCWAKAS